MWFSSEWLGRYVDLPETTEELAELLTRCGMVVEDIRPHAGGPVFDLDIPSNRVDAMNHYGVAREIATARRGDLRPPEIAGEESAPPAGDLTSVQIEDLDGCRRYAARLIRGVSVAPSPRWLTSLLEAIGLRPLNNVADITNFVLWELGHPLHAFDFDRLAERRIVVRRATPGESIVTLDETDRSLTADDLVIADAERPVAVAGVMGGAESAISDASVNVLLEGAWFDPAAVRSAAQRLNLHTDASHRFERSAAFDGMLTALDRAASLVQQLAGGELASGTIDVVGATPEGVTTELRRARLQGLLGIEVASADIEEILTRLGFSIEPNDVGYRVGVPSFRPDVTREEDLIEEIGRHIGYDRLPATLPVVRSLDDPGTPEILGERRLKASFVAAGCQEAMSSSLSSAGEQAVFVDSAEDLVALANPISEGLGVLRAHLVPGLLAAVAHNVNHGQTTLRLFEVGRRFAGPLTEDGITERWALALALTGNRRRADWDEAIAGVDFYDLKGIVERVTTQMAWPAWRWQSAAPPGIDASSGAILRTDGVGGDATAAGWAGRISTETGRAFGLEADVWVAEIDIHDLIGRPHPTARYRAESRFPGGVRDVALVVPANVAYADIEATTAGAASTAEVPLAGVALVEIYAGEEIPPGHRGVTLRFTFRADDRTLTADEIDAGQNALVGALAEALGARQR